MGIVRSEYSAQYRTIHGDWGVWESGLILTMEDGSAWFHPFSGGTVRQLREPG